MSFDAIVLGCGVDELVAAHMLARAGLRVCVVTRHPDATEGVTAGWVPPHVVRGLDLERHGLRAHGEECWLSAAVPGGGVLELSRDIDRSVAAIRPLSERDAAQWPEFSRRMHALAQMLAQLYSEPPPDPLTREIDGLARLARGAWRMRKLGRAGIEDLLRVLPMSVADLLNDWFESDVLKGALAAAGVVHLALGPRSGGTAFNFLHHHVGSPAGVFRPPRSNVHEVLKALPGVDRVEGDVERILIRDGRAAGVALREGDELHAHVVVSGAHPRRTLLELVDPGRLDPQLVRAIRNVRSRGVVGRVRLTLERAPGFSTRVFAPSLDYLERAYDDSKYGRPSRAPFIEARYEAGGDGGHRVDLHVQYVPYALRDGAVDDAVRESLARVAIETLERHTPGFAAGVTRHTTLTPSDLETHYGYPQGHAYGAELALDQVLWMRPVPQLADYRTPIAGLYLCGPAMHPGGGIAGAAGANAASAVLGDRKKKR